VVEAVLVESADAVPTDPTWPTRLLGALDLLREHILKEQNGLFPAALTTLDTADWVRIEQVRASVGSFDPEPQHLNH
jgi:hypothetical protein